jgi:hypothetical protein
LNNSKTKPELVPEKGSGVKSKPEIIAFINELRPLKYLEIGLGSGINFDNIPVSDKVCISPHGRVQLPGRIYQGLSDEIFASSQFSREGLFDLIFIDGEHRYEQVVRDIYNSLNNLSPNGVILVHDVNPFEKPDAVASRVKPSGGKPWCGDAWKSVLHVKEKLPDVGCAVIDEFPGFLVLWKRENSRISFDGDYPMLELDINYGRNNRGLFNFITLDDALAKVRKRTRLLKVVGLMAIHNFLMSPNNVVALSKHVDCLVLRFDALHGDSEVWKKCVDSVNGSCHLVTFESLIKWNRWNWREELIRKLDSIQPNYVLTLDEDETFGPDFKKDFDKFRESDKNLMMFDYEMITKDERQVKKYPAARHCKVFRWENGINYSPYRGYALPNLESPSIYFAQSKIQHWCFYTKEMEQNKVLHR